MIWSNFPLFSFLRQKPINIFLNDFFFYATDIFWTVIEWNNIFFILFLICCKIKEKKTLDTKEFLQKQETKILERYNLIKGSKLWYQMMRTSWSSGHATHMQRHQMIRFSLVIRTKQFWKERERERDRKRERESGAVGATSTPSTVGLFSFLTMLFLPTFSQHWPNGFVIQSTR